MIKDLFSKAFPIAGMIVGTADITFACLHAYLRSGVMPDRILRYVASGFFGKEAFGDNPIMPAWGLVFHYIIAFSWALLFLVLYPQLLKITTNSWFLGIGYGIFVWLVMNLAVVPMSQIGTIKMTTYGVVSNAVILILAIGLPLAFLAKHFSSEN
jgi:hypothetical protein